MHKNFQANLVTRPGSNLLPEVNKFSLNIRMVTVLYHAKMAGVFYSTNNMDGSCLFPSYRSSMCKTEMKTFVCVPFPEEFRADFRGIPVHKSQAGDVRILALRKEYVKRPPELKTQ